MLPVVLVVVELVGDVVLGFHQVLLELLLGIATAAGRIPHLPGGFRAPRIQVALPRLAVLLR